jgi:hypothetical protein
MSYENIGVNTGNDYEGVNTMSFIAYEAHNFRQQSLYLIKQINAIVADYTAQGYSLTLRQIYYQLVARDLIENSQKSYKNIGNVINDGRLAGLIDWLAIEDRTRNIRALPQWTDPAQFLESVTRQYHNNLWIDQPKYCEVWVEKDALIGVIEQTARKYDVPCFSCRGYTSQSEMWQAAQRIIEQNEIGKEAVIIHLGDHDPSGLDMTRDVNKRLRLFGTAVKVRRIALNMEQINEYNPPPNPAKLTDTRATAYIAKHGGSSWELDALEPQILDSLISDNIKHNLDHDLFNAAVERQEQGRTQLAKLATGIKE